MSKKFDQFTLIESLNSGMFLVGYSTDPYNYEIKIPIESLNTGNSIPLSITGDVYNLSGNIYQTDTNLALLSGRMDDLENSLTGIGSISGSGNVVSVFGRQGIIFSKTGDYSSSQITDNSVFYGLSQEPNVKGALNYIYSWTTTLEERIGGISGKTEISAGEILAPWTQTNLKDFSPDDIYSMITLHGGSGSNINANASLINAGVGGMQRTSYLGEKPTPGNYSIDFRHDFRTNSGKLGDYAVTLAGEENLPEGKYGAIINGKSNRIIGSGSEYSIICDGFQNVVSSGYDCFARFNFIGNGYRSTIGEIGSLNSSDYDTVVNGFYNNVIEKYNSLLFASNCNIYGNKTAILHGENISTNSKNATILRANKTDKVNDRELIFDAGPFEGGFYHDSHITLTKYIPAGQDRYLRVPDFPIDQTNYTYPSSEEPLYLKNNLTYFLYGKIYCRASGHSVLAAVWDFETIANCHPNGSSLTGINITNKYITEHLSDSFNTIDPTPEVFLVTVDPLTSYLNIACKSDNQNDLFYVASLDMVKISC